jgi:putative ABC transport system permease protein
MNNLFQDVRYAMRQLRKTPGFLAVVVLSLGLGVGSNSTIFSVLNAVLYRPIPYEHPERLVAIWETEQAHPGLLQAPPIAEMVDWKQQNHVFEDIGLTSNTENSTMSGLGEAEPIRVQNSTASFFGVLGVKPAMGRLFRPEEMQDNTQTVVLSDAFWKRKFDRDPNVLGKKFTVDGAVSTVVGVMPPGFAPFYGRRVDMWIPIDPTNRRYSARIEHWLMPVARLKTGVTLSQAQTEMDVIARRLEKAYPLTNAGVGKKVVPLHQELFGWAGKELYPLFGAVAFVLLIACVNVANLFQSRTELRRKEYALRSALGSSRGRLIRQLLVESGLLALLGAALGILLTFAGIVLFRLLAPNFPLLDNLSIDTPVLLFTLGISVFSAIFFGLAPAIHASRSDLNLALHEGEGRSSTASRSWARHALAVSEVALAMVLLVGAGLMVNTMLRLHQTDPGFDSKNLLTMAVQVPEQGEKYVLRVPGGDMEKPLPSIQVFYRQLLEKLSALPGVESVGLMNTLPTYGSDVYSFSILGRAPPPAEQRPSAGYLEVSPGIFQTLRVPLKRGRYLDAHDAETAPWSVVINEAFARQYFPNESPIGRQILLRYEPWPVDEERPRQIVGIVGDIKHVNLGQPAPPCVYVSYLQQSSVFPGGAITVHLDQNLVLRVPPGRASHTADVAFAVKKAMAELGSDQPFGEVRTMDQILDMSMGDARFYMRLLGLFAGIALLLAVVGIYGVMSYFVSERTREIGIRVALGALPSDVFRLVGGLGLKLILIGVGLGLILGIGLTRLIAGFLVGVKPTDPVTYLVVSLVLVGVALLACYIPARRATKVDPIVALRYE